MIAELGQLSLSLAFALALVTSVFGFRQFHRGRISHAALARGLSGSVLINFGLVLLAFLALMTCFLYSDFSVRNVAENSNVLLPWPYKIAATWGSHEGSLLLWILMLSGWSAAVALLSRHLALGFKVRVLSVLMLLQSAFLMFLLTSSDPFLRILPAATAGRDLNPLLQDPVMVIHPPMLYMGYVGFAVSFAFAVAALLEGRLDPVWARWTRPWANAAWSFLTIGIMLGSWWAYTELGWGGWWFWDPVENASLMPWLAGAALIHSLTVTDKRDALKSWTVLLSIIAFALSLLGTFLVRSGVLTSVHAFATDPKRGIIILVLLGLVIGSSFVLYAAKTRKLGMGGKFSLVSRESMMLINNVVMVTALFTVMLGTLYPLIAEVVTGRKMSVGPPYFEAIFAPLLLPAIWVMSVAPISQWKTMSLRETLKQVRVPLAFALLTAIAIGIYWGKTSPWSFVGMSAAAMLFLATLRHAKYQLSLLFAQGASPAIWERVKMLGLSYWAMIVAHIGVAMFVAGVTMVKTYQFEKDMVMKPNQTERVGDWSVTFVGVDTADGPNYKAAHAVFELTRGKGNVIYLLEPEKRHYLATGQVMTEAAIFYSLLADVYISLGEAQSEDISTAAWSVRVYYKPFVSWVWIGCIFMAIGGVMTLFDKRYRRQKSAKVPSTMAPSATNPVVNTKEVVA